MGYAAYIMCIMYKCEFILQYWARIHKRFTRDLISRRNFNLQILPNSEQSWMSMQHALLDIHFMCVLKEFTYPNIFRIW